MSYPTPADIKEMKARGYDPTTIATAERRLQRGIIAERISRVIEAAFDGVTLGSGIGLREAGAHDDWADEATCAAYRANDEKEDWRRIPAEYLNRSYGSLNFFDAEGMRFHLPAFLINDMRGDNRDTTFCLTHLSYLKIKQFSLLNDKQRQAVRNFLLFIADDENATYDRPDILRALNEYWVETETPFDPNRPPRGTPVTLLEPFEPAVPPEDWEANQ